MKISAVILAKNEEAKIEKAVASVLFCDEVLVIDDKSTDATVTIATKAGARVLAHAQADGFASQRNWALTQAKNDWILFIDADEEVTENLKFEISNLKLNDEVAAYRIPRRDFFWNTELKYGETQNARKSGIARLINRKEGTWEGVVHEEFKTKGTQKKLASFLNHNSHDSISSFIADINVYSSLRAQELAQQGKKFSLFELVFLPFGKFIYTYFILRGFLDGAAGFVYSFVMSFHSFLVRAKLATKSYV
jgi:glycosyltransferase involved in cell wall biosynthesis